VPVQTLAIFDDLAETYEGETMAPIEEVDRKHREYACGECNMHLPFEQISQLTSRGESLIRCPSCTRILYMQEEMRGSLAKK
jgi:predicted  nucleic acid-binding Zn-ribbon protein